MILVHPHCYGRVVVRFTDTHGLGRYVAITIKGKNGVLVTFISVYLTPATGGGGRDRSGRGGATSVQCSKITLPTIAAGDRVRVLRHARTEQTLSEQPRAAPDETW